ncbi:MAG: hypothetical protein V4508_20355 [Pseudomonadota bacterium]
MPVLAPSAMTLPSTAELLVAGGDTRIMLDASGATMYGSRPRPDPGLVALGSCTASLISRAGLAAAEQLRTGLLEDLQQHGPAGLYALQLQRLRTELQAACGWTESEGIELVLAASGTDLFLLASQWLQPQRTVMICPNETGSGVPAAVQGRHFNALSACGDVLPMGAQVSAWSGELVPVSVRDDDGQPRPADQIDAEFGAAVGAAALAGQRVLLVLTDVSKTGMMVPSVAAALALKRRWPAQVEVLVDACQFRLAPATLRAYLAHDCMVAVTGSKFMAGPTFCGALMVGPKLAARHAREAVGARIAAYSNAAEWPRAWPAARGLPRRANFGLLLRWEATMPHLRSWAGLPPARALAFVRRFAQAVRARLDADARFEAVPVPPLARAGLGIEPEWDTEQSIFPFLVIGPGGVLTAEQSKRLYVMLREPGDGGARYQLGQPVPCGERGGVRLAALRVCVDAPMLAAACSGGADAALASVQGAFDRIGELLARL